MLQGLHRYWEPLGALVAELELALGHPCQANAYLTPPGSQGFAVHSDSHDVFVFQTHGSKVWEVHDPSAAAEPQTVVLEPGVSMYLPTGTPHAARAQDAVSLHVTIGINQVTWKHVLDRALATALDEVGAQHLPAGYLDDPRLLADGLAERLETLAAAVRALDPAEVADAEVHRFLTGRTLWQRGGLRDRIAARDLSDTDRLRRRPGHPCVLRPDGDKVTAAPRRPRARAARPPRAGARRGPRRGAAASRRPGPGRAEPAGALPPAGPRGAPRSRRLMAFRCAAASLGRAEPSVGTASTVRAFLLVENAGPWGTDALRDARLPDEVKDGLRARSAAAGVRALLVRRHRGAPAGPGSGCSRPTPTRPRRGWRPRRSRPPKCCSTSTSRRSDAAGPRA